MNLLFYISAGVSVISTLMVITKRNAVHALLYLIVSLMAVALIFFALGAPFAAALEVIIYAGAIMVLFIFAIMMLNLGPTATEQERNWLTFDIWMGPAILCIILAVEVVYMLTIGDTRPSGMSEVTPKAVGIALFGPYMLGVEIASMLLLAGLVGAYHLGRKGKNKKV